MLSLSRKALRVEPSATLAIDAKYKQMLADGEDVVGFGAGEPDFDTPDAIKDAAKKALDAGFTKYTPASGTPELKQAIVEKFQRDQGLTYKPGQVIVSCGGKHVLYNIFQAICDPGDEVIFAAPYWVSYIEMVKLADGTPIVLPTTADDNYTMTADSIRAAVTPRTTAIIVNSPSNPTGTMYSKEQLEAIADLALEKQFYVITDEIYEALLYDGAAFHSISNLRPGMQDLAIIVNGCSKAYSMTGWRIGYAAGPADVIKAMGDIQSHSTSNPTSIAQKAAYAALTGSQEPVETMRVAFEKRRDLICDLLDAIPGVTYARPQGAFYVFPDVSAHYGRTLGGKKIADSFAMADYLLADGKVAVVPGGAFGDDKCFRLSFATSEEKIEKGLTRIRQALA
ncbi:pyridoxal phosphate-dependent aminotransferase [Candidatus Poribacteria bacterium]|nr:pyridoxal phosphate-dependent aminotransferase [Candidatus Poribacteria bacterium]